MAVSKGLGEYAFTDAVVREDGPPGWELPRASLFPWPMTADTVAARHQTDALVERRKR